MTLAADSYGLLPIQEATLSLLADFECGKPRLNAFLVDIANDFQARRLGFTTLVMHPDFDGVAGYFTLCNDALQLKTSERGDLDLSDLAELNHIPAVKIGRMAVATVLQGTGVSDEVMRLALGEMFRASARSAARLVVVDADNEPKVIRFYERNGFLTSLWAEEQFEKQGKKNQPRQNVKMIRDLLNLH